MNRRTILISIFLLCVLAATVMAQDTSGSGERTATLRQELIEVESRETLLKIRLEELDEQLRPENIERSVVGRGLVHPEVLRDDLRKRLTIERDGLITQLDLLEQNRAQIKAAILAAEYAAYLKFALPSPTPTPCTEMTDDAQTKTGTLHGAIVAAGPDAQSYTIRGARIRLQGTFELIELSTKDDGEFDFTNLSVGEYTLEVSAIGFKTISKRVTVHADDKLIENITLEAGDR